MGNIKLTINGQALEVPADQSVLQVCQSNNIAVPTLCHYPGLSEVGGCRLCIVEIEGTGRPVPSCTTPISEGMVVRTATPRLESLRRQTLELLFGERNHICSFCPRSGNCELQAQGYRHEMDHVRFDYLCPKLPVDNSHAFITFDHSRCILCTRCVRACDQWVGAHTLDVDERGARSMIVADQNVPLGESSCVSCGTCVSVCPTGALVEKRSAHWQGRLPKAYLSSICTGCGVGCRINASVRYRQIGEMHSAGGPSGNRVLCEKGRFWMVNPKSPRVNQVQVKVAGKFEPRPLDEVVRECTRRLRSVTVQQDPRRVVALLSGHLPLETINIVKHFMTDVVGSDRWVITDRSNAQSTRQALDIDTGLPPLAGLAELDEADLFLTLGVNLERNAGVVASYVRRGVLHRRARLLKVNPRHTWLTDWTDEHIFSERRRDPVILAALLKYLFDLGAADRSILPKTLAKQLSRIDDDDIAMACGVDAERIKQMATWYAEAKAPMVICGRGVTKHAPDGLIGALNIVRATGNRTPSGKWRLMELALQANSYGARLLGKPGLNMNDFDPHTADVAFLVLGDSVREWPQAWLQKLQTVTHVVALVAREREEALVAAHAMIPTATWAERGGTYVNLEGRLQVGRPLMQPNPGVVQEAAFFEQITGQLRGDADPWIPPGLPAECLGLDDGDFLAFRDEQNTDVDFSILESLVEAS
jgi:formate dehydrogenase major subunit